MSISLSDHFTYPRILRFVLPSIVMMLFTSIYTIVDGFFVSNCVGKNAFAALNLIFPALTLLSAFGFMFGTGGSAYIAKLLGEGERRRADNVFSLLIAALMLVGLIVAVSAFILMRPIALLLGATPLIVDDCVLYGRVLISVTPFFVLQISFQSFLVAAERPKLGLLITLLSGAVNMVLDFLLVYLLPFGLAGAAAATALSQTVGGLVPLIYFLCGKNELLHIVPPRLDKHALLHSCGNGASEMVSNLSMSLVSILYNFQLMKLAAEDGISAYGIIMYVSFIFMAFFIGFSMGVTPIVGYHYGAGNAAEIKNMLCKGLVINAAASVTMTVLSVLLALPIARLFVGYDAALCAMTANALRIYALSYLLCGFNIFASAFFTGLNNGPVSALISFLRTFVIQAAAVILLPLWLGINGIWLAITAAEGVTLAVSVILLLQNRKKYGY